MTEADMIRSVRCLEAAGVPKRLIDRAFEGTPLEPVDGLVAAREHWSSGGWRWLYLVGPAGRGKSQAALDLILPGLFDRASSDSWSGRGLLFWRHASKLPLLAWREGRADLELLERAPMAVIEDLGCENLDAAGALLSVLEGAIYERHGNARPLIITTNLSAPAMARRYGDRITSRLAEIGRIVTFSGPDLRRA